MRVFLGPGGLMSWAQTQERPASPPASPVGPDRAVLTRDGVSLALGQLHAGHGGQVSVANLFQGGFHGGLHAAGLG